MIICRHATGEDELSCLAVPQGTVLDRAFSDAGALVCLEHLARKELEIGSILSVVCRDDLTGGQGDGLAVHGTTQTRVLVDRTNRSGPSVSELGLVPTAGQS